LGEFIFGRLRRILALSHQPGKEVIVRAITLTLVTAGLAILYYGMAAGGNPASYIHLASLVITMGGGLVSAMMSVSPKTIPGALQAMKKLLSPPGPPPTVTVRELIELSQKARREGLLALESGVSNGTETGIGLQQKDAFASKALAMVVDGVEADTIRHAMELTLDNLALRHQRSIALFKAMGTFFPAWGMIGTLVGLISLLLALDDPAKIGSSMAIAMVTTFYGSVLANFFAIPVANRLQEQSREEVRFKEMVLEGILGIQVGTNPRILESVLLTFLSPAETARYEMEKESQDTKSAADQVPVSGRSARALAEAGR
jgi:chemotaxis protein MotA